MYRLLWLSLLPLALACPGYRAADTPDTRYSVLGVRVAAQVSAEATR